MASTNRRVLKIIGLTFLVVAISLPMLGVWMFGMPRAKLENLPVTTDPRYLKHAITGEVNELSLLTWNIHYGVGPTDDRRDPRSRKQVVGFLDGIVKTLSTVDADIVCLQEVDFDSNRSHNIDFSTYFADRLTYPYRAKVLTWDLAYLPYPTWPISAHWGKMRSGQLVLSKVPITKQMVLRHPKPSSNPWWYNPFYLDRTTQRMVLTINGKDVILFNVHLEAFDGDNREAQSLELNSMMQPLRKQGMPMIAMGDFNAIPNSAVLRKAFPDEPETDMTDDRTIENVLWNTGMYDVLAKVYTMDDGPALWSFPDEAPNRRLDYILASDIFSTVSARRLDEGAGNSDHRGLTARLRLTPERTENE